ncbi:hypothetical protein SPRG_20912 [Saprolegnia parasitica CBS 223.65]|uniref:Uncharacterized protein n=1 Tax=Saprolegnia parasitica (strain CBS 223.65) TaxID=695850 RepID=A0A067CCI7_SAPPC|nr:hypothetical protein SPRG_20912 [Saprolegnia parasitica CBS 223.65]KDO24537.1 hypothetical protein SPRG_20912 [Saprolegnia parasitica CBS 223.65]|eukprot:XP_012204822.1 hypothetical protein SPRG_20912 [Saprolegnia parasitica CBS 223.65]
MSWHGAGASTLRCGRRVLAALRVRPPVTGLALLTRAISRGELAPTSSQCSEVPIDRTLVSAPLLHEADRVEGQSSFAFACPCFSPRHGCAEELRVSCAPT